MPSVGERFRGTQFLLKYFEEKDQKIIAERVACKTEALGSEVLIIMSCKLEEDNDNVVILLKVSSPLYFRGEETFRAGFSVPQMELLERGDKGLFELIPFMKKLKDFTCKKDVYTKIKNKEFESDMIREMLASKKTNNEGVSEIELNLAQIVIRYQNSEDVSYKIVSQDRSLDVSAVKFEDTIKKILNGVINSNAPLIKAKD